MKAVVIDSHGGPEVVRVTDVPAPRAGPGEVVVEVRAAALNHLDLWVRKGRPGMTLKFPHVLGTDAAGVVVEVGQDACGLAPGQEVVLYPGLACGRCEWCLRGQPSECSSFSIIGVGRWGVFAERVAVPADNVWPKPPRLSFEDAAALPVAYLTAWRMLLGRAQLKLGETVLIHGVGGGVALAGLQIARLAGATCIVTSSSDDKLRRARALGADETINYRSEPDVAAAVRRLTGGRGVDVVLDAVGAATWPVDFAAVRKGGRIVLCGVTTGPAAETPLNVLYWNQVTVLGSTLGSHDEFRLMLRSAAGGALTPVIDSRYPIDRAAEALARMEAGQQFGKILLATV